MNLIFALSFVWLMQPPSNVWENQRNWSPGGEPLTFSDSVSFRSSYERVIEVTTAPGVNNMAFNGRQDFRIEVDPQAVLQLNGAITSASKTPEILLKGSYDGFGGRLLTTAFSNLGPARVILYGYPGGNGAEAIISGDAGSSRIYVNAGSYLIFRDLGQAGSATILSKPGIQGMFGGQIYFNGGSTAPDATIILAGHDSTLQIQDHIGPVVELARLKGQGQVFVGPNTLRVGVCDHFTGTVDNQGLGGSLECLNL